MKMKLLSLNLYPEGSSLKRVQNENEALLSLNLYPEGSPLKREQNENKALLSLNLYPEGSPLKKVKNENEALLSLNYTLKVDLVDSRLICSICLADCFKDFQRRDKKDHSSDNGDNSKKFFLFLKKHTLCLPLEPSQ